MMVMSSPVYHHLHQRYITIITVTADAQSLHKAYEKQYIGQLYIQL